MVKTILSIVFFFVFSTAAHAQVSGPVAPATAPAVKTSAAPAATPKTKAKAKKKTHTLTLVEGENTLFVHKDSAGFFSAAISNRTLATVSGGYVTIKAGKQIKSKLFAKPSCPKQKSYCMIKVFVHGPGSLVYGNLYRIFGYENLAVRRVFQINEDLQVTVPRAITNVEPKAKKAKEKAKAGT